MGGRIYRNEQPATDILGLPEIGRLHIGMKNERGLPQSIDWFRATGKYAELFAKAFGERPNTIQVVFPSDNAEISCNERFVYRDDKGALVARGDGRIFEIWDGKKYAPYSVENYPDIWDQIIRNNPTKRGADNWDVELTLRFIVPAIRGVVGVWVLNTKGRASSVKNLRDSFDSVQAMRGTVTTSVFDLSVHFHKSNKPGQNSRYPVLELVCNDNRIGEIRELLKPENSTKNLLLPG